MVTKDYNYLEKQEAKKDGFTLVRNSGRGKAKGDARSMDYLIDYKFPEKSVAVSQKSWEKLRKDAWQESHRNAMIIIVFPDGTKLAVVDFYDIDEVIRR